MFRAVSILLVWLLLYAIQMSHLVEGCNLCPTLSTEVIDNSRNTSNISCSCSNTYYYDRASGECVLFLECPTIKSITGAIKGSPLVGLLQPLDVEKHIKVIFGEDLGPVYKAIPDNLKQWVVRASHVVSQLPNQNLSSLLQHSIQLDFDKLLDDISPILQRLPNVDLRTLETIPIVGESIKALRTNCDGAYDVSCILEGLHQSLDAISVLKLLILEKLDDYIKNCESCKLERKVLDFLQDPADVVIELFGKLSSALVANTVDNVVHDVLKG